MKELLSMTHLNATELFTKRGGLEELLNQIKQQANEELPDVSTEEGRKRVASRAYSVSRSKTALDEAGKRLIEVDQVRIALINSARRHARDTLDTLRDEVRKPLTEWEGAEVARHAGHRARIDTIKALALCDELPSVEIKRRISQLNNSNMDGLEEYTSEAETTAWRTLGSLGAGLKQALRREDTEALAERQREADAQAAQRQRDERLAAEAVERETAKLRAELRVKLEDEARRLNELANAQALQRKREADAQHRDDIASAIVDAIFDIASKHSDPSDLAYALTEALQTHKIPHCSVNY